MNEEAKLAKLVELSERIKALKKEIAKFYNDANEYATVVLTLASMLLFEEAAESLKGENYAKFIEVVLEGLRSGALAIKDVVATLKEGGFSLIV